MNGFRQAPQQSRKQHIREMEAELKNTQMAVRISQMLVQQLMESNKNLTEDLGKALGLINELQYKVLAVQEVANLSKDDLNKVANGLRLKDFNEASDKEDQEKNYTVGDVVKTDSVIIVTSTTDNPDKGIFRSKIAINDPGIPKDISEGFMGREVGAKIITTLNGVEHTIELLGIRQPPAAVVEEADQTTVQAVENETTTEAQA